MSKKKNFAVIGIISFLLVAVLVALCVGITAAWYVSQRSAEGNLEFAEGIKIEYSNMYLDGQNSTSKTLKLAYVEDEQLKPLEVSDVTGDQVFKLANPTIKGKDGTVEYYVRTKLNINLYYKNAQGQDVLIDDTTREDFLATTEGYKKDGSDFVIANEKDLFVSLPELDVSKFVYFDGWYYLAEADGDVQNIDDMELTQCNAETAALKFLKQNLNGDVVLALDDSIDFGENMPFSKMTIALNIEAIETDAVSIWNS